MAAERELVGLEIIVEPDVVPKGTVSLKNLDAAPGTPVPRRRIEADGRVFMLDEDAPTGAIVRPVPVTPAPAPVAVAVDEEPLGLKLRKKQLHSDTAMPPRPASAESTASGRLAREPLPADDYETNVISGGFGSALWSLVKVTAVLAVFTLATVFTYLKWNDLLPWGASTPSVALVPPTPPKQPEKKAETVAAVPTAAAPKADPAHVATDSSTAVALGVNPEKKPDEPKVADKAKISGGLDNENEYDVRDVEKLRAEAVRLAREGKLDEALAKLDRILEKNPKDGDALFRRALIFHQKGDIKGAIVAYEAACKNVGRGDARSFNNLGLCHETLGDIKSARDAYERGLANDPEDPNVLTNLGRLEEDEDYKKAFARYEKALERDAKHPQARYHRAAVLGLNMDRAADAKKELEQLVAPGSTVRTEALDALGRIAIREGRFAEAEKLLREAVKNGYGEARLSLATALDELNRSQAAVDELRLYLDKNPRSAEGWKTLGAAYVKLDMLQDAKQAYEKSLAISPKDPDTLYNYALCAEKFGNFLFAIQEYEQVVKIDSNHWKALTNLARLFLNAGRAKDALTYIDRAIKTRPNEANLHLHRANALVALEQHDLARGALQRFVELAPPSDPRVANAQRAIASTGKLRTAGSPATTSTTNAIGDKPKF